MRTLSTPVKAEIDSNATGATALKSELLLFLDFDTDPAYMHSGVGDIVWNGHTWIGTGGMGSISGIPEDTDMADVQIQVKLSHIPVDNIPNFVNELATNDASGREWEIYLATFNDLDQIIDVTMMNAGFIDEPDFNEDDESGEITLTLLTEAARLKHHTGYRLTDEHQRTIHPDDKGLEYVTDSELREVVWGKADKVSLPTRGGYSGGGKFDRLSRY